MRQLGSLRRQTLRGLDAKASVILAAYFANPSDDDTAGTKAVRSTLNDIRSIMGIDR
jgi:hypothetical protein